MPHDTKMFKNSHPKAPAPTTNTFSSSNSFCRYIPKIENWALYPSAWYALVYNTQSIIWDPSTRWILILWAELENILHHYEIKEIRRWSTRGILLTWWHTQHWLMLSPKWDSWIKCMICIMKWFKKDVIIIYFFQNFNLWVLKVR